MIDLHTHTTESDGSLEPEELVRRAAAMQLEALAITDHDTFAGYERAREAAARTGLELVCGIELNTRDGARGVHLLAYFLGAAAAGESTTDGALRGRLEEIQRSRSERNERLIARLESLGVEITLDEVRALGRGMTGRPHFARVLMKKGYVSSVQEAFDRYLGEGSPAHIERNSMALTDAIRLVRESGGLPVLAHPGRLARYLPAGEESFFERLAGQGLGGVEVYHSDHSAADVVRYRTLAARYGFAVTGGSDFHGDAKPAVALGTGRDGNVSVPRAVLDRLRG